MAQILFMGASIEYGVGGPHGGWADMVKLRLHEEMYAQQAAGEAHEAYIFAKPDGTVQFVLDGYERYIADYRRDDRKTIVVLSVGMNDAKAIGVPDNYASTPHAYKASMLALLNGLVTKADAILCVGFTPVDESKFPKLNPFTGKYSYFANQRLGEFNAAFREAATGAGPRVSFVDMLDTVGDDWPTTCLSADGLHPNDQGHRRIFEAVIPAISRLLPG